MSERLLGVETEYGLALIRPDGGAHPTGEAAKRLVLLARRRLPHLVDIGSRWGLFLVCGRLYVDTGAHPEFATAEVPDPSALVRAVLAGERILTRLAAELERSADVSEALIYKCNVDYGGTRATWGCHESYCHRIADPDFLCRQIVPFLVSRIPLCGAGGFDTSTGELEFSLSPRVPHLSRLSGSSSTTDRPLYHTKDESLSSEGHHRLHLLCGESLCSQTATWWKVAATAVVVTMIEAGLTPADGFELSSPLAAAGTFSRDPTCKDKVRTTDGRWLSALDIQHRYLEQAEKHLNERFMPPWAEETCKCWRRLLRLLEGAPESVSTTLDWAIKLALFKDRVRRYSDMDWDHLPCWKQVLGALRTAGGVGVCYDLPRVLDFLLGDGSPIPEEVSRQTRYLKRHGLDWDDLTSYLRLRSELFEIDTRFGQLGGGGIFSRMDGAGVLSHRLPGLDGIEKAADSPPEFGRAGLRAKHIRELAAGGERYLCTWNAILDLEENRMLDLSDPFAREARWHARGDLNPAEPLGRQGLTLWEYADAVHGVSEIPSILRRLREQRARAAR